MRNLHELDSYRCFDKRTIAHYGDPGNAVCGAFILPSPRTGATLRIIATNADGWDHVSVSLPGRIPNWIEMDHVKRTFFNPHEVVWQYHVPSEKHINFHPNCLHLWRKHDFEMPLPPVDFV